LSLIKNSITKTISKLSIIPWRTLWENIISKYYFAFNQTYASFISKRKHLQNVL
jgi:hypothetical protein